MTEYFTDEDGKWLVEGLAKMLVEPSQKWLDEHPPVEPEPQPPSETDILAEELVKNEI